MAMTTPAGFPTSAAAVGQATLSVSPVSLGDLLVLTIANLTTVGTVVNSISGGGVTTWTKDAGATVGSYRLEIWKGVVTATGAATITPSWSASIAGDLTEYACTSFNSGLGSSNTWAAVASGTLHHLASTSVFFPSLSTGTGAQQGYFGLSIVPVNCSDGSFPGFTFFKDANGNATERGLDLAASTAFQPTCTNSGSNISDSVGGIYQATAGSTDLDVPLLRPIPQLNVYRM